jgi:hypothetical protein
MTADLVARRSTETAVVALEVRTTTSAHLSQKEG